MGFSAGSHPQGNVNPVTFRVLQKNDISTENLHSKNWDVFTDGSMPVMDFVITVCDNAASEVCPVWPQYSATAHWSITDPAAVSGAMEEIDTAFQEVFSTVRSCIVALIEVLCSEIEPELIASKLNAINPNPAN